MPVFPASGPMFAEVNISDAVTTAPALPPSPSPASSSTKIGIELPSGVRLYDAADVNGRQSGSDQGIKM